MFPFRGFMSALSYTDVSAGDISASDPLYALPEGLVSSSPSANTGAAPVVGSDVSTGAVIAVIVIALLLFAAAMILMEIARSRYVLQINKKNIVIDTLPEAFDGIKIALISDLHQMEFGEYNTTLAKKIKLEEPDYIFFAGDMGDSNSYSVDAFYDLMDSLGDDIPLICVPGNHDLRLGGGKVHKNVVDEMNASGAVLLNNTCAQMALDDEKIYVYGFCPSLEKREDVDIKRWGFEEIKEGDLERKLGKCPTDAPVLLLTHDPTPFELYAKWGATLTLCGHMHGGLVRLPFIGGLFSPNKKLFPKYTAGEYELDDNKLSVEAAKNTAVQNTRKLFVTRGLGNDYFFRFGNAPEIAILTLTRQPIESEKRLPLALRDDNALGISDEVAALTAKKDGTDSSEGNNPLKDLVGAVKRAWSWCRSETKSLWALLNERTNDLRDWIDKKRGVEKNTYAQRADAEKEKNTYLSPKNRAKENVRKLREGGDRKVTISAEKKKKTKNDGDKK